MAKKSVSSNKLTSQPGGDLLVLEYEHSTHSYKNIHFPEAYLPRILPLHKNDGKLIRVTHGGVEIQTKYTTTEFDDLWEEFRSEHPNTVYGFEQQLESFTWLYNKLKTPSESDLD